MFIFGVAAGLGTALSWAMSAIIHTNIARNVGVHSFMMLRQPLALLVLVVPCLLTGQFQFYPIPTLLLGLFSGVIGIVLCDWCFYKAALLVGVRTAMACESLYACFTALLGMIFLEEHLGLQGLLGIVTATLGVILVITQEHKNAPEVNTTNKQRLLGLVLAILAAFLMALSLVLSRFVILQGMPPLMLTFMRNAAAALVLWGMGIGLHKVGSTLLAARKMPHILRLLLIGCLLGTTGGTWLAMVALEYAPTAIAATFIGMQPIFLFIITGIIEKRCPAPGAIAGVCIACLGAAIVLLRNGI